MIPSDVVISEIKQVPQGHQYKNYVAFDKRDLDYWLKSGYKVFCLSGNKFFQVSEAQKRGRYFVLYV